MMLNTEQGSPTEEIRVCTLFENQNRVDKFTASVDLLLLSLNVDIAAAAVLQW